MTENNSAVRQILLALHERNRGLAAAHIRELLAREAALGDEWLVVAKLASQIGEKSLSLQAADAYGWIDTKNPQRIVTRAGLLAELGNIDEALAWIEPMLDDLPGSPQILHFCGTVYAQQGRLQEALESLRAALKIEPKIGHTWLTLAALKTFTEDDPEFHLLEDLYQSMASQPSENRAPYLYALGKARDDVGDWSGAFEAFSKGARLRRKLNGRPFDFKADARQVQGLISGLTKESLDALEPNHDQGSATIFVLGLPRSGTTLVEQILTSHSQISEGGELNLFGQAHLEVAGLSHSDLRAFADHFEEPVQAWQRVSKTYQYLLKQRFGSHQIVVDKSLNNSRFLASIYLAQPNAPFVWVDRNPVDTAWSCFHTYFNKGLPWSWDFKEIGQYFQLEHQLMAHWQKQFGDKILRVPYEELVSDPNTWIPRLLEHCLLPMEPGVERFYEHRRPVYTSSVAQVRRPLNKLSIGAATPYLKWMKPFGAALIRGKES